MASLLNLKYELIFRHLPIRLCLRFCFQLVNDTGRYTLTLGSPQLLPVSLCKIDHLHLKVL
ncbi:hypothetical protein L798_07868 [Zootermopsis nevadensis]|uniref:Uncharacterized protein n=1 Tax=Zootermopsis nevadensis TaxID=136037 RepID=A0A067QEX9_ZOONE|nr:hypothetical protein L798_07868 [Zootermopsis nevadensis]